jgi:hypothetical protein
MWKIHFLIVYWGEITSQWNHVGVKNAVLMLAISNSILPMHNRIRLEVWLIKVILL